jgi:hypothetical protein
MAAAPIHKTAANRVCAKWSFVSRCQTCLTSTNSIPPKLVPSQTRRILDYDNVAALDAVSPSMVASCYLMPAGKSLYAATAQ